MALHRGPAGPKMKLLDRARVPKLGDDVDTRSCGGPPGFDSPAAA